MEWYDGWIRRPVAVLSWALALLLAGTWAAMDVPLEWVPQVELPEVRISASWGGASPRAVERYVAAPIERAVQRVPGVAGIQSYSQEGRTTITVQVAEEVDLGPFVAQVNEQLSVIQPTLPERVTPRLTKRIPEALRSEQGFMTLQLIGPLPPETLRERAADRIAPALNSLAGVADVDVRGGAEEELLVSLLPERLASYRVDPSMVQQRLAEATRDAVYGRLAQRGSATLLLSPGEDRLEALRHLVLVHRPEAHRPVRLQDVAEVALGPAPPRSLTRIDGQSVVTLRIERASGSHMLSVAQAVEGRLADLRAELPEDTRLEVSDDRSEDVRAELRDLQWRGGLGLVLVLFVLLFMLKSVRASAIVCFSVAVALAVALGLMGPLNLTLNLLTLGGLVLVFGLLIDNAVVVVEQLILQRKRLRAHGLTGYTLEAKAAREALGAVWLPLLGGTLSTMAVMLPLIYLSGELQDLFLPFAVLVGLTLAASLISAALLIPVMSRYLPTPEQVLISWRGLRRHAAAPYRLSARFPKTTLLVVALTLGLPLWLVPSSLDPPAEGWPTPVERLAGLYTDVMGSEVVRDSREWLDPALGGVIRPFFQDVDFGQRWSFETRPEVSVRMQFPPGNPVARADSLMQIFEQSALASPAVSRTLTNVSERVASMRVQFFEEALETAEPYLVRERLIQRAAGQIAGIRVYIGGLLPQGYSSGIGGMVSGMRVEALGPNYEDLEALTETFAGRLRDGSARVAEVNTNAGRGWRSETREVLHFRWDPDAAARTGVGADRLAAILRPVFSTQRPSFFTPIEDHPRLPVRIAVRDADQLDVARLLEQPQVVSDSAQVKLAALTDFAIIETPSAIEREDQQYKRYVSVDYRGPARMGRDYVEGVLEGMPLPPGYQLDMGRASFFTQEVQEAFTWVLLATVFLVFLITAAVFESWRLPLVVLLSLPLAGIGVALGFLWMDVPFAEGAFIGMVLLIGIAVNDSILLTDRYRQLRALRPTAPLHRLARLAVRERLRPMWTTTLSTTVAMLPLLVFPDGSEFWMGLGVTVTGGLLSATLLIPFATVALLCWRAPLPSLRASSSQPS